MDKMPILNYIRLQETAPSDPRTGPGRTDREKLKKACTEFEAIFVREVLKFMRQTIPSSAAAGLGAGKDVYESLLDQELSRSLAGKGGLRIGEMVYRQMSRREDGALPSPEPFKPLPLTAPEIEKK